MCVCVCVCVSVPCLLSNQSFDFHENLCYNYATERNNSTVFYNLTTFFNNMLYGSETWTIKASDAIRIIAAEMKYMRRTAGYTWTDYKTNVQIAKDLKLTPILDKLLEYKRSWIQSVNRMPRNRLPRVTKYYSPTGRRNHGRPLKRLLDT